MPFKKKLVDYHVHSNQSFDAKSTIPEICQKAIKLGIMEVGFSEHMDFDPKDPGFGFFNYERYTSEIKKAQEIQNKLVIRKGIEIDYQHHFEHEIKEWLKNKKFDFTIGSVHYINHELIGYQLVTRKNLKEIYNTYFDEVTHSIKSGIFTVIGHVDLVSRYGNPTKYELKSFDYWEKVETILEEIMTKRIHLDINTKGLRENYKDTMPSKEVVKKFIEKGGKLISIGSDAHATEEIGYGIEEILNFLAKHNGNKLKILFE